jgi:pimeloyl-ACP methyl ester carboxylesterase
MTERIRSADGTELAYEVAGEGPALAVVTGAFCDKGTSADLARVLAPHRTVYRYDRRGRTDSGDTLPYAVQREVEDLAAIIGLAGEAAVYGHSSGGALALLAAAQGVPMTTLAVYEPPYRTDGGADPDFAPHIEACIARGDRAAAVRAFLAGIGLPPEAIAAAESSPQWAAFLGIAHTLPYDLAIVGDGAVPAALASITVPTLVAYGDRSMAWLTEAMAELVRTVPGAQEHVLEGQDHGVAPGAIAAVLLEFLS